MTPLIAQPFEFALNPDAVALMVIDMQRDFVEPGGFGESLGNDVAPLRAIIPSIASLLACFRRHDLPIIHTRECHLSDLSDCPPAKRMRGNPARRIGDPGPMGRLLIADEPGAQIIPELAPLADELVIDKPAKGAFTRTDLEATLTRHGIEQLILTGVTTEVCVQSTMREANDRGFDTVLVTDATESYFPAFKRATIDMVRAQGAIVGWTTTTQRVLEALDG